MCSMKCTGADSGAGTGSGAVRIVQCAVCSVQCPACQMQRFSTSNPIGLTKFLFLILGFKKRIDSNCLAKHTWALRF